MWKKAIIVVLFIVFLSSAFPLHQAMGQPTPTVSVQLTTTSVLNENDTFSANITVSNVADLYGWQVSLYYVSSVLNGTHVDEGPFLKAKGATEFIVSSFEDNYNATHGWMLLACSLLLGNVPGVDGSGTLATVTFKAVGGGSSHLHLDTTGDFDTELSDSKAKLIRFTTVDGEVSVIPEFSSLAIIPLFMIATLVSLVAFRRRKMTGIKPTP